MSTIPPTTISNTSSLPLWRRLVEVDDQDRLSVDVPCTSCSYSLRMQPVTGACPECGQPIEITLTENNLRLMPLDWVRKVLAGSICMALAGPLMFACGLGLFAWILGLLCLLSEIPFQQFNVRKTQMVAVVTGILGAITAIALVAGVTGTSMEAAIVIALAALGFIAVHVATVFYLAARICETASSGWLRRFAFTLMVVSICILPLFFGVTWLLAAMSFSASPPPWLLLLAWAPTLLLLMYGLAATVFWIAMAVRCHRLRRQAIAIQQAV